jgi:cation diffusion facilitator CzcD-associated flavoprotein CzcO
LWADKRAYRPVVTHAVVVGAGFAGLYALHKLRSQGLSVRVFEAARDVGGTWYFNRYPGCRCDVTFNTRVASAVLDRFCLMATGSLSAALTPDFAGLDSFAAEVYHTAHWPYEPVDFARLDRRADRQIRYGPVSRREST